MRPKRRLPLDWIRSPQLLPEFTLAAAATMCSFRFPLSLAFPHEPSLRLLISFGSCMLGKPLMLSPLSIRRSGDARVDTIPLLN
jgi:hypothetical protein